MTSMQDIAKKLGISNATVSLVLSGKAGNRVSNKLKAEILSKAEDMHYHVNELARSLRTGQTMTIGVIVTDISNEFFGKLTFFIQEEAKRFGYLVLTANSNESSSDFENLVNMLINKKVDGMIIVPTSNSVKILKKIENSHIPFVLVDRYCDGINADYVGVSNYESSKDAVKNMISQGYKRIGLINFDIRLNALTERRQGYIDEMEENNLLDTSLIYNINYDNEKEEILNALTNLMHDKNIIDAIYFTSRRTYTVAENLIYEYKLRNFYDLPVLCFDDVSNSRIANMKLNYVIQPIQEMAVKSFDLLLNKFKGESSYDHYVFNTHFVSMQY
jgi:LacI family transcriptional regulator